MTPTLAAILAAIDPTSVEWQAAVRRAPMLERPAGGAPASVSPLADLEDWHVLLPDGRIRGSFTTRAQIQICRTTGQRIPRELRRIEGLLVDT